MNSPHSQPLAFGAASCIWRLQRFDAPRLCSPQAPKSLRTAAALTLWASVQPGAFFFCSASLGVSDWHLALLIRTFGVNSFGMANTQSTQRQAFGTKNDIGVSTFLQHVINRRALECRPAFYNSKHSLADLSTLALAAAIPQELSAQEQGIGKQLIMALRAL